MAQKRMFSLAVVDTDVFLDMSVSAQALYFHLGMHGDDDGFVSAPKKIARAAGCNVDDLKLLAAKGFIVLFDSGVIVITDWKRNNTLKNDRYHATSYQEEKSLLCEDVNGKYVLGTSLEPGRNQDGTEMEPQHSIAKLNIVEQSKEEADKPPKRPRFTPPTEDEVKEYCHEKGLHIDVGRFMDYYKGNGWMVGRNRMRDWKATVRNWHRRDAEKEQPKQEALEPPEWCAGTYF